MYRFLVAQLTSSLAFDPLRSVVFSVYFTHMCRRPCRRRLCHRQQSAHAGAEGPVLMEIDIRMSAQNATVLLYHPPVDSSRPGGKTAVAVGSSSREVRLTGQDDDSDDAGDDGVPQVEELSRQNSGGSVKLGEGKGELATAEAMRLRDRLQLPALAASVVVDVRRNNDSKLCASILCVHSRCVSMLSLSLSLSLGLRCSPILLELCCMRNGARESCRLNPRNGAVIPVASSSTQHSRPVTTPSCRYTWYNLSRARVTFCRTSSSASTS